LPLQHLFTKREQRVLANAQKEWVLDRAREFWTQRGFSIYFNTPFQMHAEQHYSNLFLRQAVDLWVSDYRDDVSVDLMYSATMGDNDTVAGILVLGAMPAAALAVGAASYCQYDEAANRSISEFWASLYAQAGGGQPATPQRTLCTQCSTLNDPDAKFCKGCGHALGK